MSGVPGPVASPKVRREVESQEESPGARAERGGYANSQVNMPISEPGVPPCETEKH
jgi:hypothetical protein